MAGQLQTSSIAAPGFYGLNLQESSITLSSGFALKAQNCVIDRYGRIGARRGWTPLNATNSDLGSNAIESMMEVVDGGSNTIISAGNNKLFTGRATLTQKLVRNADNSANASYTITGNNWQMAAMPYGDVNDFQPHAYLAQAGHPMLVWHELPVSGGNPHDHDSGTFGFQQVGDVGTLPANHNTASFKPNAVFSGFGRIWVGNIVGDTQTVYFSDLLRGSDFTTGSAGYLNLQEVFPNADNIVAIAAHNGFLVIFGRNNIAIYANPIDTGSLVLQDIIYNVGCIARDSIQNIGTDLLFLSSGGVRSLARVIQEKSLPMNDISKNVRDDLMGNVASETDLGKIKSIYHETDAIYLLSLPTSKFVYCFDTRSRLQDGSARVTIWDNLQPKSFCITQAKELLIGQTSYIGKYFGHSDNGTAYRLQYYTNYFDFDASTKLKILKKIGWVLIGGTNQFVAVKWGFDYTEGYQATTYKLDTATVYEYNIGEYNIAEYSSGIVIDRFSVNAGGQGTIMQLGLEADINGNPLSIQKIDVAVKAGKTIVSGIDMADYNKATNFTAKDGLPTGNAGKIVKGAEIDTELTAVSNAIASKADSNSPTFTGTPVGPTASAGTNTTQIATTAHVFAERTNTATLTNKTLTSPTINTPTITSVNITSGTITGITDLAVADGGTGASTLTSKAVLIGNGTSAVTGVSPGTSGNVLTSNGTDWASTTPTAVKGLGLGGEVWNTVTGSRAFNTVYTNSRSYPILVSATTNQTGPSPYIDGYVGGNLISRWFWQFNGSGAYGGTTLLVPPGATYELRSGQSVSNWVELY